MTTPPPAGWHPDPSGRHELRYSDGTQWTEHVADNGVSAVDHNLEPLPPPPTTGATNAPPDSGPADPSWSAIDEPIAPDPAPAGMDSPPYQAPPTLEPINPAMAPSVEADSADGGTRWGLIALIVVLVAGVVGGGVAAAIALSSDSDDGGSSTPVTVEDSPAGDTSAVDTSASDPAETGETAETFPDAEDPADSVAEFGSDAELDDLALACQDADFQACDDLYRQSPFGSDYERYGDSCGERNEPLGWCTDLY